MGAKKTISQDAGLRLVDKYIDVFKSSFLSLSAEQVGILMYLVLTDVHNLDETTTVELIKSWVDAKEAA